ncbi:MAG: S9 family peptidase [candidate division Zixibacteria bacterium]|nr:S9 family peptidase [candidate division Zixibacteria bacterium]
MPKTKRLITAEDLIQFKWVRAVALSPDESKIAFTLEWIDENKQKYWSNLWVVPTSGGAPRRFTTGKVKDRQPVWSPDGKFIAFVSNRDNEEGIYIIPADGGEARKLVSMDGSFDALSWSPDGKSLLSAFRKNDPVPVGEDGKPDKKAAPVYRHITRLFYKLDGEGFLPKDGFHIWTFDLASGKGTQLTFGRFDELSPAFSPDGRWICFASNRQPDPDRESLRIDLWVIPSSGGRMRKIPTSPGPVAAPSWSPDGKKIAYVGHANPDDAWGVTNDHVWVVSVNGKGEAKDVTPDFDRPSIDVTICDMQEGHGVPAPAWSADGKRLFFMASDSGSTSLYTVPVSGGKVTRILTRPGHLQRFSAAKSAKVAALVFSDFLTPAEVFSLKLTDRPAPPKQITSISKEFLGGITLSKPEVASFKSFDGTPVQAWIMKPPHFKPGRKHPAIVQIHGGPRAQYGVSFFHEFQLLAARGYVVFFSNPRGSQGYGEAFAGAIVGDWGNLDYKDVMAGTDELIKKPFVDAKRVGVTGGSYGGFMTNWIVGHTNRYKAAITGRSVVNEYSMSGSSDIGQEVWREMKAKIWEDPDKLMRLSPISYVKNVKTPLLILHNEFDLRCPIGQGEELYLALKMLKKKVEFVRFPEEPHGLSRHGRPDRRLARLSWMLKWFDWYLKGR